MMDFNTFLTRIIDQGIEGAKRDYKDRKLDGALAGFEACRNKLPEDLVPIWENAEKQALYQMDTPDDGYWYWRCYAAEVEWIINIVSAVLVDQGQKPLLDRFPTAMGVMNAAAILGTTSLAGHLVGGKLGGILPS